MRARAARLGAKLRGKPKDPVPPGVTGEGKASVSVGRTKTFLGAKLRRLQRHMPKKKAQTAIMRTQLVIAHALLSDAAAEYQDLGPGYYERRATPAGAPAATPAPSNASATRSPSRPPTPKPANTCP